MKAAARRHAWIAFLSGGSAIRYAESTLGVVEGHRLGEIVGEASIKLLLYWSLGLTEAVVRALRSDGIADCARPAGRAQSAFCRLGFSLPTLIR